jgi:hypothetical protein
VALLCYAGGRGQEGMDAVGEASKADKTQPAPIYIRYGHHWAHSFGGREGRF